MISIDPLSPAQQKQADATFKFTVKKPRQLLLEIVRCGALNKKGKPCPFRKKLNGYCGHHADKASLCEPSKKRQG